jgi:hypothetical protein
MNERAEAEDQETGQPDNGPEKKTITFTVNKTAVTTTEKRLTGAQIKSLGKADPTDLLELLDDGKKIPIKDDQVVKLKDEMKFRTYPGGSDS